MVIASAHSPSTTNCCGLAGRASSRACAAAQHLLAYVQYHESAEPVPVLDAAVASARPVRNRGLRQGDAGPDPAGGAGGGGGMGQISPGSAHGQPYMRGVACGCLLAVSCDVLKRHPNARNA